MKIRRLAAVTRSTRLLAQGRHVCPLWVALWMICCVCGCTTSLHCWKANGFKVGPNYRRPAAPLESSWIDIGEDPQLSVEPPDLAAWWLALNDPVLNGLIDEAYQQNLTLRQAGERIQQADAIRGVAVGNLFPQFQQAVGDYQRIRTSDAVAVPSPVRSFDQFDLGVNAAWELDFWGRFRRSVAVADANLDASIADFDDIAVILLSDVATTYVQIRTLQERIELTRRNVESQRGSLRIAESRYAPGGTNKLDVIQSKNNVYITESVIPALEADLRIANNRLCVLLGFPPRDLVAELPPMPVPTVSESVQVGIPADLLRRRPDIRFREQLVRAQSERIGIAEADLYPRISLVGAFEWQAENLSDLVRTDSVFALAGPTFGWNILNYGRIRNSIENQVAQFRESVLQYQESVLTAQQEVEDAIIGFRKAHDQVERLVDAVAQADEASDIVVTLYRTGATDFNRVYLIQSVQFAQQDQLVLARASEVLNLIKIYRALGGGWQIRCPNLIGSVANPAMMASEQEALSPEFSGTEFSGTEFPAPGMSSAELSSAELSSPELPAPELSEAVAPEPE